MTKEEMILSRLYDAVIKLGGMKSYYSWGYYAIEWYVNTARASVQWVNALGNADPEKLLIHLLRNGEMTDEAFIDRCTKYLIRYCGLKI